MLKVFDIKNKLPSVFMLSLILAAIALYFLLYGELNQENWTPGPISKSHGFIEKDCKTCHIKNFSKIEDKACLRCHNVTNHSKKFEQGAKVDCVNCHMEHQGEHKLSVKDDSLCLSCHADLNKKYTDVKIKNVVSFSDHPDFALLSKDPSTIKLNHQLHLKPNLRGSNGPTKLNCNDCHKVDKLGRRIIPIKYEANCSSCHMLEFDERMPGKTVPHGKTDIVYNFMFREYSSLFLNEENVATEKRLVRPGAESAQTANPDYALKKVQDVTREIEVDLISKRGCVLCHDVTQRKAIKDKKSLFHVKNPNLPTVWMKGAIFKHGTHEFSSCETCHSKAKKSKETVDVLLPKIKDCNTCHGKDKASAECLTCHSFHDSLAVDFLKKQPADKFH